jgi:hypothetical protein
VASGQSAAPEDIGKRTIAGGARAKVFDRAGVRHSYKESLRVVAEVP